MSDTDISGKDQIPESPVDDDPELPRILAYSGEIELFGASWSLDSGRMVEFRLVETEEHEKEVNPFKSYQKRRGGKVGQIFGATIVDIDTQRTVYSDELMLAGWADSDRGKTVRFWIDDSAELHCFSGYAKRTAKTPGSFFAAAFVLVDDSGGRAIDLHQEAEVTKSKGTRQASKATSIAIMISGELFLRWLLERAPDSAVLEEMGLTWTAARAKHWVYKQVGIESLSELNTNTAKMAKFDQLIRIPFSKWAGNDT